VAAPSVFSVAGRSLDVMDHEHLIRLRCRFELQSELFAQGRENL
jgi:hypothetical protein